MILLVSSSPSTLLKDHGRHPNLGVLSTPSRVYMNVGEWPWAADNEAYTNFDEDLYVKMLNKIKGLSGCLFVTCPDVVGDAEETMHLFYEWSPLLRQRNLPVGLVGQDGLSEEDVPWLDVDAYFVGGSSEWKLGEESAALIRAAKATGAWVHMGRVNTERRIKYAKALGCDSADGSKFSKWRQTYLDKALTACALPIQETASGAWRG